MSAWRRERARSPMQSGQAYSIQTLTQLVHDSSHVRDRCSKSNMSDRSIGEGVILLAAGKIWYKYNWN